MHRQPVSHPLKHLSEHLQPLGHQLRLQSKHHQLVSDRLKHQWKHQLKHKPGHPQPLRHQPKHPSEHLQPLRHQLKYQSKHLQQVRNRLKPRWKPLQEPDQEPESGLWLRAGQGVCRVGEAMRDGGATGRLLSSVLGPPWSSVLGSPAKGSRPVALATQSSSARCRGFAD